MPSKLSRLADPQQQAIDEFIALTPGEADAHDLFRDLALATDRELQKLGSPGAIFLPRPDSGFFGSAQIKAISAKISDELVRGWKRFAELYQCLIVRHPRLELRNLMQDISERREGASWPHMWEWAIEKWIFDGAPEAQMPYPIDDGIRDRLLELYPLLGGWLYMDETATVLFAETAAFRQVKVSLDAERSEIIRRERASVAAAQQRYELRVADYKNARGSRLVSFGRRPENDDRSS